MRHLAHRKFSLGSRKGIALLAVLAFVLLLTILIVSYISFMKLNRLSTASYSSSVQAQEIAQGGLQDIISDLRSEIIAGSIKDPGTIYTQNGVTIYVPALAATAAPARIGYVSTSWSTNSAATVFAPSLVRVSRASKTTTTGADASFFTAQATSAYTNNMAAVPGGVILNRASVASTANSSVNGRSISAARWNKTYLLASTAATVPTPFTTAPPDWVYVTRTGSRVCDLTVDSIASLLPSSLTATYATPTPGTNPVASPVVGRYAFVMYDEGGLLDANVAGYPSTAASLVSVPATGNPDGISQALNGKSYSAYADLTQLPGLTSSQSVVDTFVNWRNASFASTPGSLSGPNFFQAVYTGSTSGFQKFQSSPNGNDSPFLSRQDLINYFSKIDTNINTTSATFSQALPYLGTFSRAVSAPTYSPPLNSQNIPGYPTPVVPGTTPVSYKDNAEHSGVANRDLANVRYTVGGSVTHYYDDQSSATPTGTYSVNVGDPLLQNRFSLAKIAWLTDHSIGGADPNGTNPTTGQGPSTAFATAIQAGFGLVWGYPGNASTANNTTANGGNKCWNYCGSTGTSPVGTIETLDQVAAESTPREPNFFELLKSAILSGSLGVSPGKAAFDNGKMDITTGGPDYHENQGNLPNNQPAPASAYVNGGADGFYAYSFDRAGTVPAPAQVSDVQIIQIGANIIDQYDADSYPTAIYFPYAALNSTSYDSSSATYLGEFGPTDMVYGDENLPELHRILSVACTTDGNHGTITPSYSTSPMGGWWQPELWNPHQEPNPANSSISQPTHYVIQAYGNSDHTDLCYTPPSPPAAPVVTTSPITPLDGQIISFTDGSPATSSFYAQPALLTVDQNSGVSATTSVTSGSPAASGTLPVTSAAMKATSAMFNYSQNHFVGFSTGVDTNYCAHTIAGDGDVFTNVQTEGAPVATFCLGWSTNGTDFHPYSFIHGVFAYSYWVISDPSNLPGSALPGGENHGLPDPRTHRFGSYGTWQTQPGVTMWPYPTTNINNRQNIQSGWGMPAASNFVYQWPNANGVYPSDWEINQPVPITTTGALATYYADPDGVIRPGDGEYGAGASSTSSGDGIMLFTSAATPTGSPLSATDSGGNVQHGRRPIILNRPFRSVGELGYVFRDLPFKTLDFFSTSSADAALLDVFSLTDESKVSSSQLSSVVAGQVDLSNAPLPVLNAILIGGSKKDLDSTYNLATETTTIAKNIGITLNPVTGLRTPSPLLNRSMIVTNLSRAVSNVQVSGSLATQQTAFTSSPDKGNKAYLEAPERALSNVANTRTWNLLIDVIAQSGQLASTANTLDNFVVQGERRYWLHLAIDRYSGKIVAQQLEPVYE